MVNYSSKNTMIVIGLGKVSLISVFTALVITLSSGHRVSYLMDHIMFRIYTDIIMSCAGCYSVPITNILVSSNLVLPVVKTSQFLPSETGLLTAASVVFKGVSRCIQVAMTLICDYGGIAVTAREYSRRRVCAVHPAYWVEGHICLPLPKQCPPYTSDVKSCNEWPRFASKLWLTTSLATIPVHKKLSWQRRH